ncbi:MAG: HigA family addiction module antitoxin [Segetibacter sp.]
MPEYKVIDANGNPVETNITLHPGSVLADELEARNILKKDFAALIGLQPSHLSDLLKGKRHVSAKLALKLEQHLQINASFWLRVQIAYDLFMAKKELQQG